MVGLCWPSLMAVMAGHPDAEHLPALARQVEVAVLTAVAQKARAEAPPRTALLDRVGPPEAFEAVDPDGPFPFDRLLGEALS